MSKRNDECVRVAIRCRPLSKQETIDRRRTVVEINEKQGQVLVTNPKGGQQEQPRTFTYDIVIAQNSTQEAVFDSTALPIIEQVLQGYNGTIFAYGQTGTGKTYTMEGIQDSPELVGIIPRAFDYIFHAIEGTPDKQFLVNTSMLELYNEEIRDLLSRQYHAKLELREHPEFGVYVKDLSSYNISEPRELKAKLDQGRSSRHTGETQMNQDSSRSHSIFSVRIEMCERYPDGSEHVRVGKLNLVDLAGSERQSKTQSTGDRFKEAVNINQSLATLGNVISALVDKASHIPYRDSKLTRLLQDSLGGNTKTVMIANIGPADYNYDETLSTLRYAYRAKSILNKPKINEDPKDALIRSFQDQIEQLKNELLTKFGKTSQRVNQQGQIEVFEEVDTAQMEQEEFARLNSQLGNERAKLQEFQGNVQAALSEKEQISKALQDKQAQEAATRDEQRTLLMKIKEMQETLLQGDTLKRTKREKEQQLLQARYELEQRIQREQRLADELAEKRYAELEMQDKAMSLQDQIASANKKLEALVSKIQTDKSAIEEMSDYRLREQENQLQENRIIARKSKLMDIIIDHFIDPEEVEALMEKMEFSVELDDWKLKDLQQIPIPKMPESAYGLKKPLCELARTGLCMGLEEQESRFKDENILTMRLDDIQNFTTSFNGQISKRIIEAVRIATAPIDEDADMVDAMPNVYIENPDQISSQTAMEKKPARLTIAKKAKNRQQGYS